ncbi:DUF4307 domain-containing protein [Actinoplanes sp. NBRC 103695]|uniref:DUF4307 domain-containing protein n=1 Tax=Actinoplanes sp. NBRC 103695 TaxID=3032202 RepID=UPI0024A5BDC3|nr:DUF4307 domain-containing protein [Actinoplanes sp. NBRC 103695]GLY96507.1 hypothetical protein Acsp02_37620 [Actinoplanes sp. NBRC 103695]
MNETRATAPVFPPGRYGHRRAPGMRRRIVPIVFGVLILVASVLLTVRLYDQWGQTAYESKIVGWSNDSDTRLTIEFDVRVPAAGAATCVLRARSYDGAEVGRREVRVANPGSAGSIRAREDVPTSARASHGDVVRCRASS